VQVGAPAQQARHVEVVLGGDVGGQAAVREFVARHAAAEGGQLPVEQEGGAQVGRVAQRVGAVGVR